MAGSSAAHKDAIKRQLPVHFTLSLPVNFTPSKDVNASSKMLVKFTNGSTLNQSWFPPNMTSMLDTTSMKNTK
jgi:hypothetical protein